MFLTFDPKDSKIRPLTLCLLVVSWWRLQPYVDELGALSFPVGHGQDCTMRKMDLK